MNAEDPRVKVWNIPMISQPGFTDEEALQLALAAGIFPNLDDTNPHYGICRFCNKDFDRHEHSCPHSTDDDPVYKQLREPWTDTP